VRLLLLRGERNIRILDLNPPTDPDSTDPAVSFIHTDIRDIKSVRDALTTPFPSTGKPPTVIFHTAALIRFWERASYSWHLSYDVNVRGIQNVLTVAANDLPAGETLVVYTSTCGVACPRPRFMRLGLDLSTPPWDRVIVSDEDCPLPSSAQADSNYTKSKVLAEHAVIEANGRNGLRTGIIRPGVSVSLHAHHARVSTLIYTFL
jgi:nucleoside-diphosphate-sugar epimerase